MDLSEIGNRARQLINNVRPQTDTDAVIGSLLTPVSSVLMVFDNQLVNLADGRTEPLQAEPDAPPAAALIAHQAAVIAQAARRLLSGAIAGRSSEQPLSVVLLLPPSETLFTHVSLPGVAPQAVRPALALHAVGMLPAWDEALSAAVNVHQPDIVAWLPAARVDSLFDAFAAHNLFLAAIQPRPLFIARQLQAEHPRRPVLIHDHDARHVTALALHDDALSAANQCDRQDLQHPEFLDQWQLQTTLADDGTESLTLDTAQRYVSWVEPRFNDLLKRLNASYCFVPAAALAAHHQFNKGKLRGAISAAAAVLLLIGSLPFIVQSVQLWRLESRLADLQTQAVEARADQAVVREFETRWGMLSEFPRQNVPEVMLALQDILNPSVLTSLEINEGRISIEGDSPDPQSLLETLERNPLFTEVDFARATSNNRYYIDLRLTTANFPAYYAWHFPERR